LKLCGINKLADSTMNKILTIIAFLLISNIMIAQNSNEYINSIDQASKLTAYTEIVINATPEVVRARFLEFEKWPEWNSVITKLEVISGDINDLRNKTQVDALFKMDTTKKPTKAPMKLWVTENSKVAFVWEVKSSFILRAYHVFLFLPTPDGKSTKLVHYEKMTGFLSLFMSKKIKANMVDRYGQMNKDLKRICEESL
jgi:hypothetical protein